jgi:immune inhibitor A
MLRKLFNIMAIIALAAGIFYGNVMAQDVVDPDPGTDTVLQSPVSQKRDDQPNPLDYQRNLARAALMRQSDMAAEASSLTLQGKDKVLVILVEFAGLDTFTWTKGVSTWDPLNRGLASEGVGLTAETPLADRCNNIAATTGEYSYSGPMHNQIPTPLSYTDNSGTSIWTQDFNPKWFEDFMFGNGVKINYQRVDGSVVNESFIGKSVRNYYKDMSNDLYDMDGTVVGWLSLPHSAMWYANNGCPGARSGASFTVPHYGGNIPGAGSTRSMVADALAGVNAKIAAGQLPGFKWSDYDLNGDKVIDRLWVVHAGYGEESDPVLLNRTNYGEGIPWSHSTGGTPVLVDETNGIYAGPYIVMPENGGINVFAHEAGHNLGADDLYTYGNGETSAGFWTLMSDSWTGYPIAFQPQAMDPMHLDWWGWLNPKVITDPSQVYTVTLQQASTGPTPLPEGTYKAARIDLPKGAVPQPVPVWQGSYYWFGGKQNSMNSGMQLKTAVAIPATGTTTLSFDLAYSTEEGWDFLWIQASDDAGTTWKTLTNANTICNHDPDWVGENYGFPKDMCKAGVGGFSGHNPEFPLPQAQIFDLAAFAGKSILVRFWYMTDSGTLEAGPYLDDIKITAVAAPADGGANGALFADDAETVNNNWLYAPLWIRAEGVIKFDQSFYVQWRNTNANGGYDATLGDVRWRYGKANTGMVMWYNNTLYTDNEIENYLTDYPSFGPKGMMLVVDSHPDPYRFPSRVGQFPNEGANLASRGLMRDAPFTLTNTVSFVYPDYGMPVTPAPEVVQTTFDGLPAVKTFHDSLGYYPGSEKVVGGGPAQTAPRWITKQWDASVVMPSTKTYSPKAPGYLANEIWRYRCTIGATSATNATLRTNCYAPGNGTLGVAGGNGNPGDVEGQYGWHVELLSESPDHNYATVRIWNSHYAMDSSIISSKTSVKVRDSITYTASFKNTGGVASFLACAAIDTSKVTYVAGSAEGSPLELPACPVAGADMIADPSAPVGALVWKLDNVAHSAVNTFTYQVKAVTSGVVASSASIISFPPNQTIYSSQTTNVLTIMPTTFIYTPFLMLPSAPTLK